MTSLTMRALLSTSCPQLRLSQEQAVGFKIPKHLMYLVQVKYCSVFDTVNYLDSSKVQQQQQLISLNLCLVLLFATGFYDPEIMSKRSFIYNYGKKWIPV